MHSYVKTCVATGGGIVTEKKNWGKLQTGMVVWLDMKVRGGKEGLRGSAWLCLSAVYEVSACVVGKHAIDGLIDERYWNVERRRR